MDNQASGLIGIGGVVAELGVPRSTLRLWASRGLIPEPGRITPGDRRVWRLSDLPAIRDRANAQRERHHQREAEPIPA